MHELVDTGAVDSLDLKGCYKGTPVDVETDPELYRMVIEAFPDAWLEDPDVSEETKPILDPVSERVTWDAPIHSVPDVLNRPWRPKMVNIKPSRWSLRTSSRCTTGARAKGCAPTAESQTELGVGRDQIQYLASLFHPDTPNDTARRLQQPELPEDAQQPDRAACAAVGLPLPLVRVEAQLEHELVGERDSVEAHGGNLRQAARLVQRATVERDKAHSVTLIGAERECCRWS